MSYDISQNTVFITLRFHSQKKKQKLNVSRGERIKTIIITHYYQTKTLIEGQHTDILQLIKVESCILKINNVKTKYPINLDINFCDSDLQIKQDIVHFSKSFKFNVIWSLGWIYKPF